MAMAGIHERIWHRAKVAKGLAHFWIGGAYYAWVRLPRAWRGARDPRAAARACRELVRGGWLSFLSRAERDGMVQVDEVVGGERIPDGPCVIVANHPTILDVVVLTAKLGPLCVVANGRYFKVPAIGSLLRACRHVDGADGGVESGARVIDAVLGRLAEGDRVLLFPEGTRSLPGRMHPFSRGAFEIASRAGVPLVPVFLEWDPPLLTKEMPWWRTEPRMSRCRVVVLGVEHVGRGRAEARAARERVEAAMRARLASTAAWDRGEQTFSGTGS